MKETIRPFESAGNPATITPFWAGRSVVLIAVFIALRLGSIAFLYWLTSGNEVASDVKYLQLMINNPLGSFLGTAHVDIASYPPLQPLILAALNGLYSYVFPDFISIRLVTFTIELGVFIVALQIASLGIISKRLMDFALLILIFAPYTLLTSVFFVQDEVICQLFIALAIYNVLRERVLVALCCLSIGVLVGKVFLIVPLFYLMFFHRFKWMHLFTGTPIVLIYSYVVFIAIQQHGNIPFVGFTPTANFSSLYWVLFTSSEALSSASLKSLSLLISLASQLLLTAIVFWNRSIFQFRENALFLICLPLSVFFFTFYQHNPEYVTLVALAALLIAKNIRVQLFIGLTFTLSWLPNIIFGILNAIKGGDRLAAERAVFFESWLDAAKLDFNLLHTISVWVYSILYAALIIKLIQDFVQKPKENNAF